MKAYRKRFIQLNMLLIGLVLFMMMAVIAVYMYQDYYNGLKTTMEQVVQPLRSISDPHSIEANTPSEPKEPPADEKSPTSRSSDKKGTHKKRKDIMTIFYTPGEADIDILSRSSSLNLDEETLVQLLDTVTAQENRFGVLYRYHIIYHCAGNGNPYKIALTSTSYISHSMLRLILVLFAIWTGAMLCFLFVSTRFSKLAVRPLEEAIQREKQFVADASHDLKTPLSVILANNSILRENPQATIGSLEKWINSTQDAAKNMQLLIGDMLTLADLERKDASPVMDVVDLSSVLMKSTLQLESVAYEKNVILETDIPEQFLLSSNEDYLQRIATSLIENAIKYEPEGGSVMVRLTSSRHAVLLEIQNQGSIIPKEDLPHIFDRFYRGDKSRQMETGGHGLGLSITRQMVENLHGSISTGTDNENRTIFSVKLPI